MPSRRLKSLTRCNRSARRTERSPGSRASATEATCIVSVEPRTKSLCQASQRSSLPTQVRHPDKSPVKSRTCSRLFGPEKSSKQADTARISAEPRVSAPSAPAAPSLVSALPKAESMPSCARTVSSHWRSSELVASWKPEGKGASWGRHNASNKHSCAASAPRKKSEAGIQLVNRSTSYNSGGGSLPRRLCRRRFTLKVTGNTYRNIFEEK
mmetsp:Transcript_73059/g.205231  ORF Transcript_73059/g.205231 Transcript_73059/m.205231 type:complete len:211 (-) Transcript_73059:184-816(-)